MTSTPVHSNTRPTVISTEIDLAERFPVAPTRNIRRPIVSKQRFSRTPAVAARQDGVDTTTVNVRHIAWTETRMSDCVSGCKVYAAEIAGRRVEKVMHHSGYGCDL